MFRRMCVLLACIAVSGCMDVPEVFLPLHVKVNMAFPPDAEIRAAEVQMRAILGADAAESFDASYASQLEQRALACMDSLPIHRFDSVESIRAVASGRDCLKAQSEKLLQYLGARLIAVRNSQPPRGVPANLDAEGAMQVYPSGAAAGTVSVSLQGTRGEFVSLELPQGQLLVAVPGNGGSSSSRYRTANGRVTAIQPGDGGLAFFDAESGKSLWQTPGAKQWLAWMPEVSAAWQRDKRSGEVVLVDMQTGKAMSGVFGPTSPKWVIPLSGSPARALVGWERIFSLVGLERGDEGIKVNRLNEYSINAVSGEMIFPPSLMSGGGTLVFVTSQEFVSYDLASGKGALWPVRGLKIAGHGKLSENTILVDARQTDGGDGGTWVFDIEQSALLPVESQEIRLDALSAFSRLAVATRLEKRVGVGVLEVSEILRNSHQGEVMGNVGQIERSATGQPSPLPFRPATMPAPAPSAPPSAPSEDLGGRFVPVARDTQIVAVGVYRGDGIAVHLASGQKMGQAEVRVRSSGKPIVLVLSSHEPVRWILRVEPGAKLAGLFLAGQGPSTIAGAGAMRAVMLGNVSAYQPDSPQFNALNQEIIKRTGKGIDIFQGRYDGGTFDVGG